MVIDHCRRSVHHHLRLAPGVVFYTDWLWFKDLGYQTVFSTMLVTKVTLGLTVGLLAAAFTWLNFGLAVRPSHEPANVQEVSRETGGEAGWEAGPRSFVINGQRIPAPDLARLVGRLALPAALAIGAYAGLLAWRMGHLVALPLSVAVRRGRSDLRA